MNIRIKMAISILCFYSIALLPGIVWCDEKAVIILLDASESMRGKNIDIAKNSVLYWINESKMITDSDAVGMRLIGGNDCRNSERIVSVRKGSKKKFTPTLFDKITAGGNTPLTYSFLSAVNDLERAGLKNKIVILFTDGKENCGKNPNPCKVIKQEMEKDELLKVFLVDISGYFTSDMLKCIRKIATATVSWKNLSQPKAFTQKMESGMKRLYTSKEGEGDLFVAAIGSDEKEKEIFYDILDQNGDIYKKGNISGKSLKIDAGVYSIRTEKENFVCLEASRNRNNLLDNFLIKNNKKTLLKCYENRGVLNVALFDGKCNSKSTKFQIVRQGETSYETGGATNENIVLFPGRYLLSFYEIYPAVEKDVVVVAGKSEKMIIKDFGQIHVKVNTIDKKNMVRRIVLRRHDADKEFSIRSNETVTVLKGKYDLELIGGCRGRKKGILIQGCELNEVGIDDCCQLIFTPGQRIKEGNLVVIRDVKTGQTYSGAVGESINLKCNITADIIIDGYEALDINMEGKRSMNFNENIFE